MSTWSTSHTDAASASDLHSAFPDATREPQEFHGDITVEVDREHETDVVRHARDKLGFDLLIDRLGDDLGVEVEPRFTVTTILYNLATHKRLHFRTRLTEDDPVAQTLIPVFRGANWFEREIFDMYGLRFEGHPDLRRILMPDFFDAYPLRKDYPMEGRGRFAAPRRALGGNVDGTQGQVKVPDSAREPHAPDGGPAVASPVEGDDG